MGCHSLQCRAGKIETTVTERIGTQNTETGAMHAQFHFR